MKKLPIGIQSFKSLREDDFLYVDKTRLLYTLAKEAKYYFLSRPRRFGKSLLLSTLKAYFQGKRELFEGLAIAELEKDWNSYPILYLDLNVGLYTSVEGLIAALDSNLSLWEQEYGIQKPNSDVAQRFKNVILSVSKKEGKQVVVLVDEYDKPLLQVIDNEPLLAEYRNILKGFYSNLKTCDEHIRFAFLTGVTKFSHVSIFSDLNNLQDISLNNAYADICGFTEEEIRQTFAPYIQKFAKQEQVDEDAMMGKLKARYDGYHFSPDMSKDVYNPFSVLNALSSCQLQNYWFSTGTPTFLVKLLKDGQYKIQDLSEGDITATDLSGKDSLFTEPVALLYQTGYLTIKGFDKDFDSYSLGFPNKEVELSFLRFLLPKYVGGTENRSSFYIEHFVRDLRKGDIDSFMERMAAFLGDTPYELIRDCENHFQNVLFTVCRLMGYHTIAEYRTSRGRIDMVVKTDDYTYVFEFKFDKSAQEALQQIDTKEYMIPFTADGRQIVKIGVNFSKETRNIEGWEVR